MTQSIVADPARRSRPWQELALLLLLAVLWSASYSFIKIGVETIAPITFIAARTLIAGLLLTVILALRGLVLPRNAKLWRMFAFQAAMNSVIPFTLIAWAERSIDAGLATILNSTTPIFVFLFSLVMGGAQRSLLKVLGVAAGFVGVVLIVGLDAIGRSRADLLAEAAVLLATATYAIAALYGRQFRHLDPMVPAAGSMLCGCAMLAPASVLIDRPWTLDPSLNSLAALLALATLSTALAFVIYFRLIATLGSIATSSQSYIRTPIGVLIGIALLGETLAPTAWIGLVCVVIGVAAMTIEPRGHSRA